MREIKNIVDEIKKSINPYEEYLSILHAHDYTGTDDDMIDSFENYITNLDCEEHIQHANALIRMIFDTLK